MEYSEAEAAVIGAISEILQRSHTQADLDTHLPLVLSKGKSGVAALKRLLYRLSLENPPPTVDHESPLEVTEKCALPVEPPAFSECEPDYWSHAPQSTDPEANVDEFTNETVSPRTKSETYDAPTRPAHIAWVSGQKCSWGGKFDAHVDALLTQMLLNEYADYAREPAVLADRVQLTKAVLAHGYKRGLKFSVFPHRERFTLDTLKDMRGFQYYMIYMCLFHYYKVSFGLAVNTCGTSQFVDLMNAHWDGCTDTLPYLLGGVMDTFIDILSVSIMGDVVSSRDKVPIRRLFNTVPHHGVAMLQTRAKALTRKEDDIVTDFYTSFMESNGRKPRLLVCIAYLETDHPCILHNMLDLMERLPLNNPDLDITFAYDNERIAKDKLDATPWSIVTRVRNRMLDKHVLPLFAEGQTRPDYIFWLDADIVKFPPTFPTKAIALNPKGVTAPLTLIEGSTRFYDFCGYVQKGGSDIAGEFKVRLRSNYVPGRNVLLVPPYFDRGLVADSNLVEMDCVGCLYVVPFDVFDPSVAEPYGMLKRNLQRLLPKHAAMDVNADKVRYADSLHFTDHVSICTAIRARGDRVCVHKRSVAYHANCPLYNMSWH